jgi:hypothetical protein
MAKEMYRQGDLLFIKVDGLPAGGGKTKKKKDDIILKGEATGHAHRIVNGQILEYRDWRNNGMYLQVEDEGKVVHEEHATIFLTPGFWLVVRQREYNAGTTSLVLD